MRHRGVAARERTRLCLISLVLVTGALAQWEPDTVLGNLARQTYATSGNLARRIATSSDTVHAAWYDWTLPHGQINYRRSTDAGQTWTAAVALASGVDTWPDPTVAVAGSVVHVAWHQGPDSAGGVWYLRSTDGGQTWSQPRRLSDTLGWGTTRPSLTATGPDVHLVWLDGRRGTDQLYYKRSTDAGATWGVDTYLGMDSLSLVVDPTVAASDSGIHIVWLTLFPPYPIRQARSLNGGATWSAPTTLATTMVADRPDVACTGKFVHVAWTDIAGIMYRRSIDNGGTWLAAAQISGDSLWPDSPCLAASGTTVHSAYVHSYDNYTDVYYRRSTDIGATWGPEFDLSDYSILDRGNATVATSGAVVHVLWQDNRGSLQYKLYYRRNTHNGAWVEDEQHAGRPRVEGNPTVVRGNWWKTAGEGTQLLDVFGRTVSRLDKGRRMQEQTAPGVYFLIAPRNHFTRKLVVVR